MKTLAKTTIAVAAAITALAAALTTPAEEPKKMTIDEAFKAAPSYKFGQSREPWTIIAEAVTASASNPAGRRALAARLAGILTSDAATSDAKQQACQRLSTIATAEQVPALAALLTDVELSDDARFALERITGPEASAALRSALPKCGQRLKVGIINSLGQRRDPEAVSMLANMLTEKDAAIVDAAATALGRIGNAEAAKTLAAMRPSAPPDLRPVVTDALLRCAESLLADGKRAEAEAIYRTLDAPAEPAHVRVAALRGVVNAQGEKALATLMPLISGDDPVMQTMALRLVQEIPGPEGTKAIVALLPKMPPPGQVTLLGELASRKDGLAKQAVVAAMKSADESVRAAAVRAMGTLGGADDVPMLARMAATAKGAEKDGAAAALRSIRGPDVDAAIVKALDGADAALRTVLIRALGVRGSGASAQAIAKFAEDADAAVRAETVAALGLVADDKALPALVRALAKSSTDDERQAVEKALVSVCGRSANKMACADAVSAGLAGASGPARITLLRVLGRIGGEKALAAVRAAINDADTAVQDAALRALADWPDAAPASDLLTIARSDASQARQVIALRGFVRLVALSDRPNAEKVRMYKDALAAARRPEEKRMVLAGAAGAPSLETLAMAKSHLADPDLKGEAAAATVKIASALAASHRQEATEALRQVISATTDDATRKLAQDALAATERFGDYLMAWQVSGPYLRPGTDGPGLFDAVFGPEQPGAAVKWTPLSLAATRADRPFVIDLAKATGENANCAAYLRTHVWSPKQQDVLLELGSDDGIKVWVNGRLVHANNVTRPCSPGSDKAKATLKPGWNTLLVKVTQGGGEWEAAVRVRAPDGSPIDTLRYRAEPESTR